MIFSENRRPPPIESGGRLFRDHALAALLRDDFPAVLVDLAAAFRAREAAPHHFRHGIGLANCRQLGAAPWTIGSRNGAQSPSAPPFCLPPHQRDQGEEDNDEQSFDDSHAAKCNPNDMLCNAEGRIRIL